ncbi:MAG: NAD(P)-dependent oxidoreductase [Caldilineaceae bacterium]
MTNKPNVLIARSEFVRNNYLSEADLARLANIAHWDWFAGEGGGIYGANESPEAVAALTADMAEVDALVLCHGAPTITGAMMEAAPRLRFIGELEGDRFASRIDLEAAWQRNIRTVDTTNGSSYPVAEWALALTLVAIRNAGAQFRRIIAGDTKVDQAALRQSPGTLTGRRVGLIGCGHMGRRLIKLLRPFEVDIWVHDPYLPREMAEALGFLQTSLDNLLAHCDVIICLAPLTPGTRGMIGEREIALIRPGSTLVSVSRGPVIQSAALVARLKQGDIFAGLDVFDPEPIPPESEIIDLPNVFLSPHIGYYGDTVQQQFFTLMVDELERFFQGHETFFDLTPRSKANRTGR